MLALAAAAALVAAAVWIGKAASARSLRVIPVATPVTVEAPKVPAPVVTVNVPPAPPPPPSPPPPPPEEPPPPRARVPHLDAACIAPDSSAPVDGCAWDNGFPAISADGALIAIHGGLGISFHDAKTARFLRHEVLREVNELPSHGDPEPTVVPVSPAERRLIERRVAAVQRTLAAGGFRSLRRLGSNEPGAPVLDRKRIHAEIQGTAVRIVDPERAEVLGQHRFVLREKGPSDDEIGSASCFGPNPRYLTAWWDPATGLVVASIDYTTGGCMCPVGHELHTYQLPAAALGG